MNIKVSNISLNTTDAELRRLFSQFGNVDFASVNRNSLNGRSLKSGVIDMPLEAQARLAIASLDKTNFNGKVISVSHEPAAL